mmetsp:Transcript_27975/g.42351  ORF Transcript_27975/g.42351 Transcript_27975/m.42351 type:complete len:93 (+) Transcript_27975:778-1056(+)
MEYPKNNPKCKRKRKRNDFTMSPPDDNDSFKKDGSGNQLPPTSGRNGGSCWIAFMKNCRMHYKQPLLTQKKSSKNSCLKRVPTARTTLQGIR